MALELNRLSAKAVTAAKGLALLADGGGLYLRVAASKADGSAGAKSWVFIYRLGTKRTEIGLGSLTAVTLAKSREIAGACRALVAEGKNPKLARAANVAAPTFGQMADSYIEAMEGKWKNAKHREQWHMTLREYAKPLRDKPVNEITVEHAGLPQTALDKAA